MISVHIHLSFVDFFFNLFFPFVQHNASVFVFYDYGEKIIYTIKKSGENSHAAARGTHWTGEIKGFLRSTHTQITPKIFFTFIGLGAGRTRWAAACSWAKMGVWEEGQGGDREENGSPEKKSLTIFFFAHTCKRKYKTRFFFMQI